MKKELTIEHLAAYLPYGVRVYGNYEHPFALESDSELERYSYSLSWNTMYGCLENQERLILRPLSDLTKPITHNGETFVPNNRYPLKYFVESDLEYFIDNISTAYYHQIKYLHSLHFDTFGLIEAGLAIDINTLPK